MLIQTHDGKQFDIPEENLEGFLKDYNKSTGFNPATLSTNPKINPERGVNFGGGVRSALQGITGIGSYADEAEATIRAGGDALVKEMLYQKEHENDPKPEPKFPGLAGKLMQGMEDYKAKQERYNEFFDQSYDKYLKNARESYEGAKENMPEIAYPLEIGTGIASEAGLAILTGGASLHPAAQGALGAAYGYGMGEGDATNRAISAGIMGSASAALPFIGKYGIKYGIKKPIEYVGGKLTKREMPALMKALKSETTMKEVINDAAGNTNTLSTLINKGATTEEKIGIANDIAKNTTKYKSLYNTINPDVDKVLVKNSWSDQLDNAITDVLEKDSVNPQPKYIKDRIKTNLLLNTSKGIDSGFNNMVKDNTTKTLLSNIDETVDKLKLAPELAKDIKDRVTSEALARRTANTLVDKPLQESGSLINSLLKDAGLGITGTVIGGALGASGFGGVGGALIRNLIPGSKGSFARTGEKLINNSIDQSLKNGIKKQVNINKNVADLSLNKLNPGGITNKYTTREFQDNLLEGILRDEVKPFEEDTAKQVAKFIEKKKAGQLTEPSAVKKIVSVLKDSLKPKKIWNNGPKKELIYPAIIKSLKPVGIREATRAMDEVIPYSGKEQYQEEIYPQNNNQQPVQRSVPQSLLNELNNPYSNLVLALGGNEDTGPSMYEKIVAALLANDLKLA